MSESRMRRVRSAADVESALVDAVLDGGRPAAAIRLPAAGRARRVLLGLRVLRGLRPGTLGPRQRLRLGFDVVEEIGRGRRSRVYRAVDRVLGREVALKVAQADAWGTASDSRLLAEARLLARIDHPNVVRIHGIDRAGGRPRLVLELVRGATLQELLGRGGLPIVAAVEIGRQLCRAVGALHAHGFVHGDLKPANVMRDARGRVVLLDFGFAHPAGEVSVAGTPIVMAPEQFRGEPAWPAADVYSLGVVLFWLVAGRPPYLARTAAALRRRVLAGRAPRLPARLGVAGQRLRDVLRRALSTDPALRPATARHLEAELDGLRPR